MNKKIICFIVSVIVVLSGCDLLTEKVKLNSTKEITSVSFIDCQSNYTIDNEKNVITLEVPSSSNLDNLTPVITHNGVNIVPPSLKPQNFNNQVNYIVYAEDNSTKKYTVIVKKKEKSSLTSFKFLTPDVAGTIDNNNGEVHITVPFNTPLNGLTPIIQHNGAYVSPESGIPQDFTNPVEYTVIDTDGAIRPYRVLVTTAPEIIPPNEPKSITSFNFEGLSSVGLVNEETLTINIEVPFGTPITSLIPTITHTGASITPSTGVAQNFTNTVKYTVTATDNTIKEYNVNVSIAPQRYSVTYFGNTGSTGSVPVDNLTYRIGDNFTILDAPHLTKSGNQFAGWNTEIDGSGETYTTLCNAPLVSGDVSLYAVWIPNIFRFKSENNDIEINGNNIQPADISGEVIIPPGVTSTYGYIFDQYHNITSVSFPASLKKITGTAVTSNNLAAFNVDARNMHYKSVDGVLFTKNMEKLIKAPATLSGNYTIPNGVKTIAFRALWHLKITSVVIPNTVTNIESQAFFGSSFLSSFSIPASVTVLGDEALNGYKIQSITVDPANLNFSSDSDGNLYNKDKTVLIQPVQGSSGTYTVKSGVKVLYQHAFTSSKYNNIVLPEGLLEIGESAFWQCLNMTQLVLPQSLTTIKRYSFWRNKLTNIVIPKNVTTIYDYAFRESYELTTITFESLVPPEIVDIYSYECSLFYNSPKLVNIYVPAESVNAYKTAPYWSKYASKIAPKP